MTVIGSESIAHVYNLPTKNRQAWLQTATRLDIQGINSSCLASAKNLADEHLTKALKQKLEHLKQPRGPSFLVLHNMPIDSELPSAPKDGKRPSDKNTWVSEIVLLGTIAAAGFEVFSFAEQKNGALVQDIAPVVGLEKSNSNASKFRFPFHADDTILKSDYRPEGISLLCLHNHERAITWFAPLDEILEALDPYYLRILRSPRYRTRTPESFSCFGGKVIYSEPRPIIYESSEGENEIAVALYSVQLEDKEDEEALMALNVLRSVLKPPVARPIALEPGDMLVFSNLRGLHARSSITGERWLQRVYFKKSLEQLQQATNSDQANRVFSVQQLVLE